MRSAALALAVLAGCPDEPTGTVAGTDADTTAAGTAASSSGGPDPTTGDAESTSSADGGTTFDPTTSGADSTTGTLDPDSTSDGGDSTAATGETTAGDCVPAGGALSFAVDVFPIIMANCHCHIEGDPSGLPMPDAATAYDNLVNVFAVIPQMLFVDPGDHEGSYLFHKVNGTWKEAGGAGDQMPLEGPPLEAADVQTIADWIDGCALP